MNKSIIHVAGHLARDVEYRTYGDGSKKLYTFTVGSTVGVKDKKVTNWFRCCVFGNPPDWKLAELVKGANVDLTGELKLTVAEKNGVKYTSADVNVWEFSVIKSSSGNKTDASSSADDNDVPF